MPGAFQYRPKYVDIRVNKPEPDDARAPEERACDRIGCVRAGAHRAPKSRERANEYWFFCREHASEYNRNWNYFEGMSEADFINFQAAEEVGHRPVWSFKPGRNERLSASRFWRAAGPGDSFGLFGGARARAEAPERRRRVSRLQAMALEVLSLDESADSVTIRTRYAELVKRWHPDSNGGDRSHEALLQKAVQAYQTLKQGGLA